MLCFKIWWMQKLCFQMYRLMFCRLIMFLTFTYNKIIHGLYFFESEIVVLLTWTPFLQAVKEYTRAYKLQSDGPVVILSNRSAALCRFIYISFLFVVKLHLLVQMSLYNHHKRRCLYESPKSVINICLKVKK